MVNNLTMKRHKWTKEEHSIVRSDYIGTRANVRGIADRLGVTENAVRGQAAILGIRNSRSPDWTPKEDISLGKLVGKYPASKIARKLHRTLNAVTKRIGLLGMSQRGRNGWYTKTEVCEILGVSPEKAQQWINQKVLKASYNNGRRPRGDDGLSMWHIETEDLREFIIKHTDRLLGRNVDLQQIVWIFTGDV